MQIFKWQEHDSLNYCVISIQIWQSIWIVGASACVIFTLVQKMAKSRYYSKQVVMVLVCAVKRRQRLAEEMYGV